MNNILYLNSANSSIQSRTIFNNVIDIDITEASISSNKPLSVRLNKFSTNSRVGKLSVPSRNLLLIIEYGGSIYDYSFNTFNNDSLGINIPCLVDTSIEEILRELNDAIGSIVFQLTNDCFAVTANVFTPLVIRGESNSQVLRALGFDPDVNLTMIFPKQAPNPFDLKNLLPNIYLQTTLNMDSAQSNNLSNINILDVIPTQIMKGTQSTELIQFKHAGASNIYNLNDNIIYESLQDDYKNINERSIDNINIKLVDEDGENVFINGTFSIELEFKEQ